MRKTYTKQFREDLSNRITQYPTTANIEREEKSKGLSKMDKVSILCPSVWANGLTIKMAGKAGQEGVVSLKLVRSLGGD